MSDGNQDSPLQKARTGVLGAMAELERVLYNLGYDAGFDAGWDAAGRRWQKMLNEAPPAPKPSEVPPPPDPPKMVEDQEEKSFKEIVMAYIILNPGLRGIELVERLAPDRERTIRTALHRLKASGDVKNVDGKWYASSTIAQDLKK